jgi:hypothetical protein
MRIGIWPRDGRWSVASNWKGHPRYLFIGWWFAYQRGISGECDGYESTVDRRNWRIGGREFERIRPLTSYWAKYWAYRIAYGIHKEIT